MTEALEAKPHKVEYFRDGQWVALSDTYDCFASAATIATALENRGHTVRIVEVIATFKDLPVGAKFTFLTSDTVHTKISPRRYSWRDDYWGKTHETRVGTIKVAVYPAA